MEICEFISDKIDVNNNVTAKNYISTENMLANKQGITVAGKIPSIKRVNSFRKKDVLISNIRPYFKKIWFSDIDGGCSADVLVLRAKELVVPEFLYCILSTNKFFDYMTVTAKGTKMPRGDKQAIKDYEIDLPSMEEQIMIAEGIFQINSKINLNIKINDNLEQQVQALFKSWFIDFDPFGGIMPNDWYIGCVGDYCSVKSGYAFKSSWWQSNGIKVIKIKNITPAGLDLSECSFVSPDKAEAAADYTVNAGDLLIAMTGATIGKFSIVPDSNETLLVNQRVGKFNLGDMPTTKLPFIYCLLQQNSIYNEIINRGQGSAQPNISPSDIQTIPTVMPNTDVILKFNKIAQPLFETIILNLKQNVMLSQIRDTLLPKMMSGEIDFS